MPSSVLCKNRDSFFVRIYYYVDNHPAFKALILRVRWGLDELDCKSRSSSVQLMKLEIVLSMTDCIY